MNEKLLCKDSTFLTGERNGCGRRACVSLILAAAEAAPDGAGKVLQDFAAHSETREPRAVDRHDDDWRVEPAPESLRQSLFSERAGLSIDSVSLILTVCSTGSDSARRSGGGPDCCKSLTLSSMVASGTVLIR